MANKENNSPWQRISYDYSGLTVLVTGATSGIGAAIAEAYFLAGAEVIVTGTADYAEVYNDETLSRYRYIPLQLSSRDSIDSAIASIDKLDILVNNAGGTGGAEQPFDFDTAVYVNLNATHHLSEGLVPQLTESQLDGGASIVNLASEMSLFAAPYFPGYGAAKAAIVQLTKTMACVYAGQSIRANAVLPGSVRTKMTEAFAANDDVHQAVCNRTPLKRWGEPLEIAAAALFLSSPSASFVSGHTLVVDGAYSTIDA